MLTAGALLVGALLGTSSQTREDVPLFTVDVRVVYLPVSARDAATGRYVTDLQKNDFVVYENGRPQEVVYFEGAAVPDTDRAPVRMSLLLDMSNSMEPRITDVRDAALVIVHSLKPGPRPGPEDDDLGRIVMFHDRSVMTQDFTHNRSLLEEATHRISGGGATKLYTSLYIQLREMESLDRTDAQRHRNVIVVLSDGIDTTSLHTDDEIIEEARSSGVVIYTVLLPPRARYDTFGRRIVRGKRDEELAAENFMHRLAHATGGTAFQPDLIEELSDAYRSIVDEVAVQYRIGYQPTVPPDGQLRHISVHTPGRPGTLLQHRPSYRAVR